MSPAAARGGRVPLAERLRPHSLDAVVGQDAHVGPGTLLGTALATGEVPSLVLWGPPGCGKTTLGRLLAEASGRPFVALSAVTSGVKDVRDVVASAAEPLVGGVLLFVDEIHRFNRSQQDAFLPHIENGTIVLVGATTENPGFSLVGALLSRLRVVVLDPLGPEALGKLLDRALADEREGWGGRVAMEDAARTAAIAASGGDARRLLNLLESAVMLARAAEAPALQASHVAEAAQQVVRAHDPSGDDRYDLLSAFHKSLRASDVDAALFWMARLLVAGEDPRIVARRLLAMSAEDVGLADPQALQMALAAADALDRLGAPEGELALAQAVIYAALAPKSNSVVLALRAARDAATIHAALPVPLHLRNAPTRFAKQLGHGLGYIYPHDFPQAVVGQPLLPEDLADLALYEPKELGHEREMAKRLAWWRKMRAAAAEGSQSS